MPNRITSKLAAKLSIRQIEALGHADALGEELDAAVHRWWEGLFLPYLRRFVRNPSVMGDFFGSVTHFARLGRVLLTILEEGAAAGLTALCHWSHASAVDPLHHILPDRLQQAALRENLEEPRLEVPELEPAENLSKAELWKRFKALQFPPPTVQEIAGIVYAGNWQERLQSITKKAAPEALARELVTGYAAGEHLQQLAKRVRPALDNVRSSARRLARTEGMRVAHESQMAAWDRLGDMLIGHQIHATIDQHTRPWHAARSGTVYYREPTGEQKGPRQMPRPPLEAPDPGERPAGTPQLAHY